MKTIIAGSRSINDYFLVEEAARRTPWDIAEVISGGARGVDRLGERLAEEYGLPVVRFLPDWSKGKGAGFARNKDMAHYADALLAVWDGTSRGTSQMIDYARRIGLNVYVVNTNDQRHYRVDGHKFIAGYSTLEGKVYSAAPIIRRHVMGRDEEEAKLVCFRKGWLVDAN